MHSLRSTKKLIIFYFFEHLVLNFKLFIIIPNRYASAHGMESSRIENVNESKLIKDEFCSYLNCPNALRKLRPIHENEVNK